MERYAKRITVVFVVLQIILYFSFLSIDLVGTGIALSGSIKYTVIVLCFCYALLSGKGDDKSIFICLKAALFFTLISDLFILLLDHYYYGVLTFILVQQLYGIRLSMARSPVENGHSALWKSFLNRNLIQLIITVIICLILRNYQMELDGLIVASIFYFSFLFANVIRAWKAVGENPRDKGLLLFAVGVTLFLLCDINVGLFNLSGYISMPRKLYSTVYSVSSILMWFFYAPSQVLIALSVAKSSGFLKKGQ